MAETADYLVLGLGIVVGALALYSVSIVARYVSGTQTLRAWRQARESTPQDEAP